MKKIHLKKDQLLIGLLTGVLLLIIVWPTGGDKNQTEEIPMPEELPETSPSDIYTKEMEQRLEELLSQVEGVGRVSVMVTWKSSSEKVVEKDVEESLENTVYREAEDGSRTPYVVKEIKPVAEGVLVVAEGGGNGVVARQILEAVQALFPLDAHKIKIMKMEGSK